jgi:hypothetical protein
MKRQHVLLFVLLAIGFLLPTMHAYADQVDPFVQQCAGYKDADYANPSSDVPTVCREKHSVINNPNTQDDDKNPLFGPDGAITKLIGFLSIVTGIIAVIALMASGLRFITSGNNPQEVNVAREMIIYAIVAIFVAASAQIIVRFWLSRL